MLDRTYVREIFIAALLLVAGCSDGGAEDAAAYCSELCDCAGCVGGEDACLDRIEAGRHAAERADCSLEYSDLVNCLHENLSCRGADVDLGSGECHDANEALGDCMTAH